MRHRSVQRRLSRYLDGELQGRQRQRVEAHLARCPDCGRVFRTLTVLVGRLHVLRGAGRSCGRPGHQAVEPRCGLTCARSAISTTRSSSIVREGGTGRPLRSSCVVTRTASTRLCSGSARTPTRPRRSRRRRSCGRGAASARRGPKRLQSARAGAPRAGVRRPRLRPARHRAQQCDGRRHGGQAGARSGASSPLVRPADDAAQASCARASAPA